MGEREREKEERERKKEREKRFNLMVHLVLHCEY